MTDKKEFSRLLTNLQIGLDVLDVKTLNSVLKNAINSSERGQIEIIDYVLSIVCEHYTISRQQIMQKSARGVIHDARDISYCLLVNVAKFKVRFVAKKIFNNWPNSVQLGVNRLKEINPKLKDDKAFYDAFNILQDKLNQYINQKEIKHHDNK